MGAVPRSLGSRGWKPAALGDILTTRSSLRVRQVTIGPFSKNFYRTDRRTRRSPTGAWRSGTGQISGTPSKITGRSTQPVILPYKGMERSSTHSAGAGVTHIPLGG